MTSAAFPRFAPRLNLDAIRPRDWRWKTFPVFFVFAVTFFCCAALESWFSAYSAAGGGLEELP